MEMNNGERRDRGYHVPVGGESNESWELTSEENQYFNSVTSCGASEPT